jgi:hypothetical protein
MVKIERLIAKKMGLDKIIRHGEKESCMIACVCQLVGMGDC